MFAGGFRTWSILIRGHGPPEPTLPACAGALHRVLAHPGRPAAHAIVRYGCIPPPAVPVGADVDRAPDPPVSPVCVAGVIPHRGGRFAGPRNPTPDLSPLRGGEKEVLPLPSQGRGL